MIDDDIEYTRQKVQTEHRINKMLSEGQEIERLVNTICNYACKYDKNNEDVRYALTIFNKIYEKYKIENFPAKFFREFARMYILLLKENSAKMTRHNISDVGDNIVYLLNLANSIDPDNAIVYLYFAYFYRLNLDIDMFKNIDAAKLADEYFNKAINRGSQRAVEEYKSFLNTYKAKASFEFFNTDKDLSKVTDTILNNIETSHFSMLLYGPQGCGKEQFAHYISEKIREHYKQLNCSMKEKIITPLNFDSNFPQINGSDVVIIKDEYGILSKDLKRCYAIFYKIKAQTNNVIMLVNDIADFSKDFVVSFLFKIRFSYMNSEQDEAAYELFFNNKAPDELKRISGLTIDDFTRIEKQAHYLNIKNNTEIVRLIKDELTLKFGGTEYMKPLTEFDTKLVNCDVNINKLLDKLKNYDQDNPFSILIYGPPGTGKSYFLRYLAQTIGIGSMEKKPAELFSKYQGEPAKNVLQMFEEAEEKKAMLIIDEVEGIISERKNDNGTNKWKSDMTNTFLSSMESCKVPFAGTSNHLNKIDKAILRRFVFKLNFDYLTPEQAKYAFEKIFGHMAPLNISELHHLTSGDFSIVKKKALIMGCMSDPDQLYEMLKEELKNKEVQ